MVKGCQEENVVPDLYCAHRTPADGDIQHVEGFHLHPVRYGTMLPRYSTPMLHLHPSTELILFHFDISASTQALVSMS